MTWKQLAIFVTVHIGVSAILGLVPPQPVDVLIRMPVACGIAFILARHLTREPQ